MKTVTAKTWPLLIIATVSLTTVASGFSSAVVAHLQALASRVDYRSEQLSSDQLNQIEEHLTAIDSILEGGSIIIPPTDPNRPPPYQPPGDREERVPPALADALRSNSWTERQNAVNSIGGYQGEQASLLLVSAVADLDSDVRNSAIAQLNKRDLRGDRVVEALALLFQNNSWNTRQAAAVQLGRMQEYSATRALILAMDDMDGDVQNAINGALANRYLGESNVDDLGRILNASNNWHVRQSAAVYLGKTHSRRALDVLYARMSTEMDGDVKNAINQSIQQLRSGGH